MADWLAPAWEALDAAQKPCRLFFRDDDAGWDTPRLGELLDRFDHHAVPIDLAAIPTEIHTRLSRELLDRAKHSSIRVHQHGFTHVNHEPEGRKCEFGPSRTETDQKRDIATGQELLIDALGPLVDPVFTPPWNRCTDITAEALVACGIEVLSRPTVPPSVRPPMVRTA